MCCLNSWQDLGLLPCLTIAAHKGSATLCACFLPVGIAVHLASPKSGGLPLRQPSLSWRISLPPHHPLLALNWWSRCAPVCQRLPHVRQTLIIHGLCFCVSLQCWCHALLTGLPQTLQPRKEARLCAFFASIGPDLQAQLEALKANDIERKTGLSPPFRCLRLS